MILLKKKTGNTYFDFDKILTSGYTIQEDYDRITQKYVNGNRKQILSENEDVIITINLATIDKDTTNLYLSNLTSGEYMYYSINDKTYKSANFIIESRPIIKIQSAIGNDVITEDYEVKLLKSSNISTSL